MIPLRALHAVLFPAALSFCACGGTVAEEPGAERLPERIAEAYAEVSSMEMPTEGGPETASKCLPASASTGVANAPECIVLYAVDAKLGDEPATACGACTEPGLRPLSERARSLGNLLPLARGCYCELGQIDPQELSGPVDAEPRPSGWWLARSTDELLSKYCAPTDVALVAVSLDTMPRGDGVLTLACY